MSTSHLPIAAPLTLVKPQKTSARAGKRIADAEPNALISSREAARRLGVTPTTLRWWRWTGKDGPPYYKLSARSFLYNPLEIQSYLEERRHDPSVRASLEGIHATRSRTR